MGGGVVGDVGSVVGEVVRVEFPFTGAGGPKPRPVVLLADVGMGDWIACQVTSRSQRREGDIALAAGDMAEGGLDAGSWARPNRLQTVNDSLFLKTYGRLSDAKLAEVRSAVRALFA